MPNYSIIFNGNDISIINGLYLYNYNATDLPNREIKEHKIARRSLSIVTSAEYVNKTISVFGKIRLNDRSETEEALTELKGLLTVPNGKLVVKQSGELYEYTATMNEFNIQWHGATAYITIVFNASTPIASSQQTKTLFNVSTTESSVGQSFLVDGSYQAQPVINLIYGTVTGGNNKTIHVLNAATNQGIEITASFTTGSVVEIDTENYTVTVDGDNSDFRGLFPTFPPGLQRLSYSDDFTTRSVSITGQAKTRII